MKLIHLYIENFGGLHQYELDFSECTTLGEIYAVIREVLNLPEEFGENLCALWDVITGMIPVPAEISVIKCAKNPELISYIEKIIVILHRAEKEEHLGIRGVVKE